MLRVLLILVLCVVSTSLVHQRDTMRHQYETLQLCTLAQKTNDKGDWQTCHDLESQYKVRFTCSGEQCFVEVK